MVDENRAVVCEERDEVNVGVNSYSPPAINIRRRSLSDRARLKIILPLDLDLAHAIGMSLELEFPDSGIVFVVDFNDDFDCSFHPPAPLPAPRKATPATAYTRTIPCIRSQQGLRPV